MNILRWNRKSNKKIKPKTLLLLIFSLIMTTFAWFAYSKVLEPTLNIHMASWDITYEINGTQKENPISIEIPILYPTMDEETVIVDIFNNGETDVDIDHQVKSLTVAGITFEAVDEGLTPTSDNYITIAPSVLETQSTTDEATGTTIVTQLYKGAVTNDITRFPFTIEIEHSAQVEAATKDLYGGEDTPGQGYLKVTVNWIGDNDLLDSEWGYKVGEYLASQPEGTPAMTIVLSIDSYQVDPEGTTYETTMPSTAATRPYLPDGYTRVPGTSLTTGLVIEDENGNQFVWVEVPRSKAVYTTAGIDITQFYPDDSNGAYSKIEADLRQYVEGYSTRPDAFTNPDAIYGAIGLSSPDYTTLKQKVLKSIYSHGGFYIGRYETGLEGDARTRATGTTPRDMPVIKANVYPYNWVTCPQATTIASRLTQTGYTSSLMFGIQWDLVLKYIDTKGTEQDLLSTKVDSTLWGNYKNNSYTLTNASARHNQSSTGWLTTIPYEKIEDTEVLVSSGANSGFCRQNIYDIAGNLSEWTYNAIYDDSISNYVGGNGGDYLKDGDVTPANYYGTYNTRNAAKEVGFRIALISEADVTVAWGDDGSGSSGGSDDSQTAGGPYLPSGFSWANTEHTEILDPSNNQYVWISVPQDTSVYSAETLALDLDSLSGEDLTDAYDAIETDLHTYTGTYRNGTSYTDTWYSEAQHGFASADDYNALKYKMLKSVFENGGFYVGKYETGIADTEPDVIDTTVEARTSSSQSIDDYTPIIQANAYPYNWVTNKQAQELASTKFNGGGYTTSLMFGVQWDLVLKHLEVTNAATTAELKSDSTEWGNYYNNTTYSTNANGKYATSTNSYAWTDGAYNKNASESVLLSTGASTEFERGGIYDLAGNVYEWTLEYTSFTYNPCAHRGGGYYNNGNGTPASGRYNDSTTVAFRDYGFRVSLF